MYPQRHVLRHGGLVLDVEEVRWLVLPPRMEVAGGEEQIVARLLSSFEQSAGLSAERAPVDRSHQQWGQVVAQQGLGTRGRVEEVAEEVINHAGQPCPGAPEQVPCHEGARGRGRSDSPKNGDDPFRRGDGRAMSAVKGAHAPSQVQAENREESHEPEAPSRLLHAIASRQSARPSP